MNKKLKTIMQYSVVILSIVFIIYGTRRGEIDMMFNKAVNICLECIGLG